ncbi:hypothetical protein ACP70R_023904 [Stipagrostis hirtigluma subsp. patula]
MPVMGMLAGGLLEVAARKVAAAAGDRIMRQWRFNEDLEKMRETMESIKAVLGEAERRAIQDASTELWLKRLVHASHDISDLLDEFDTTRKSPLQKRLGSDHRSKEMLPQDQVSEAQSLPLEYLREITNNFSDEHLLGKGGFGNVYKGVGKYGVLIAVKRLTLTMPASQDKQFENEIRHLMKLKHPNIVQLVGYCSETEDIVVQYDGKYVCAEKSERLICLEYLTKGSLHKYLSDESSGLDWDTRYKIIEGICYGLHHLHEEWNVNTPIIHMDLKPPNILLDDNMVPKIADFGLSRLFGEEQTRTRTSNFKGTLGYMAPEYINRGMITKKLDIFSLGVIIVEIVTGNREYPYEAGVSIQKYIQHVIKNWRIRLEKSSSSSYTSRDNDCRQIKKCIQIGLMCVNLNWEERPTTGQIIKMLHGSAYAEYSNEREFKILNPFLKLGSKFRMANNMKKLRQELEEISNDRDKYKLSGSSSSTQPQVIRNLEWPCNVTADILGRDQEKQEVIDLLMEASNSSDFIVLPIYGMGNIGKTTLAILVYNHTQFKAYKKAWVFVSQTFDLNKIRDSITSELQKDQNQLTDTVEPDAANKKILIVLDDVWEKDSLKLDALKRFLKDAGKGCKMHVIVTTRDADIAQKMKTNEAKKINHLPSDMCWAIIKQIVGFEERADKEMLEVTGKEIAAKCGGVALAARALGHMLKYRDFSGWVSVKDSCLWNLSMPGHTRSEYDHVCASLNLSFRSMNAYLRLCFAYCAIFPKGHKMAKDDLIYQWAALGFLEPSPGVSAREHGERYINQLLGISFFEHSESPSSAGSYGEDTTLFTMHDLVHDLAMQIMGDEVFDASINSNTGTRNCRYAALADCSKPLNSFLPHSDKITALRLLGNWKIGQYSAGFSIAKYLRLRVLDFGECSIEKLPSSIGKLKQLRYLNAPGIQDGMIPSCITKLSKLIYLNLRGSSAISALPESIGEMEDLMYLNLSGCSEIRELPESFGKLKNLVHVDFSKCTHVTGVSKFLENLTQLQYLNLSFCTNIGEVPVSLGRLTKLQYLNLSCSSYFKWRSDCDILSTLTNLEHLDLSSTEGLSLQTLPEALGSFTQLKYLNMSGCKELKVLPRSFGRLKNLVHLDLSGSYPSMLGDIPEALSSNAQSYPD